MRTTRTSERSGISGSSSSRSTSSIPGARAQKDPSDARTPESTSRARGIPGARALKGISSRQLLSRIRKLSETERKAVLSILIHLIEIERRKLYLPLGFSSLFEFCMEHLGYSESTASRRIRIARCIRDFPQCYRALASGKVSMTSLAMITRIINTENASELLSRIEGTSSKEVELLVSSLRPKSAIRDSVTPVYVKTLIEVACDDAGIAQAPGSEGGKKPTATGGGKNPATFAGNGPEAVPDNGYRPAATELQIVLEQKLRITFGADPEFLKKVDRIRSLLSSKHHGWLEFEKLFSILIDEYIERNSPEGRIRRKEKRKQRMAEKEIPEKKDPRTGQKPERSRYIPRKVRDEVHTRDKGQCTYVSAGGRKCGSMNDLQIDHIVPFARGGDNSPSNLRLLCGKHNRLEAERAYGKKHMKQFHDTKRDTG